MKNPFKYFKTSPEVIRLAVMMYIAIRCRCAKLKTFCSNVASTSVTRRCVCGGTGLGQCSPPRSGSDAFIIGHTRSGDGIWTKVCQEGTRRSVDVVDERSGAAMLRKR